MGAAAGAEPKRPAPTAGCVFCDPSAQPEPLFVTSRLRVFPDLYPVVPGHALVTPVEHVSCFGAAPPEVIAEAEAAAKRVARFLQREYGVEPLIFENGVAGQTVFHAHLHVIPLPRPVTLETGGDDATPVSGLEDLPQHFARLGRYHYASLGGTHVVMTGDGASSWRVRLALGREAGLARVAQHYMKVGRSDEVRELGERWRRARET